MIDHFNGVPAATEYLLRMQGKLAISVITFAEVLTGFEGKERQVRSRPSQALRFPPIRPVLAIQA